MERLACAAAPPRCHRARRGARASSRGDRARTLRAICLLSAVVGIEGVRASARCAVVRRHADLRRARQRRRVGATRLFSSRRRGPTDGGGRCAAGLYLRGFESSWEIPAEQATAIEGRWIKAPGDELFHALHAHFDPLPLVAEDLGIITPEVEALRLRHGFPGMKILQFAFEGGPTNPYLPHNYQPLAVVYT